MRDATSVHVAFHPRSMAIDIASCGSAQAISYRLNRLLPLRKRAAHVIEFLEFMVAVYAADRLVKRDRDIWNRDFMFHFPVTRLSLWHSMKKALEDLLFRSMGDRFELKFQERSDPFVHVDSAQATFELDHQSFSSVVLLSDGLDSLCGAISALESGDDVVFVSIVTNSRRSSRLSTISRHLRERYPGQVRFMRMHDIHIEHAPRYQEQTQRSRTMLAIAAGLTASAVYESESVAVSENGIGILNLPIPSLQMQHESSQVLHPANLECWLRISQALIGGGRIVYPNRYRTKGQMIDELPKDLRHLICSTISCDRPQRFDPFEACGVCSSCRYRQVALVSAGCSQFDGRYTSRPPQVGAFDPADLMMLQAQNLDEALSSPDPWKRFMNVFPTLRNVIDETEPMSRAHQISATIDLLRKHVDEVAIWHGGSRVA